MAAVDVDVLVVGAGPTGLTAALLLARAGVSVRIVDQAPARSPYSRALVVQARSLELLDRLDAAAPLVAAGHRAAGLRIHPGGARVVIADVGDDTTPFPFVLLVSQAETERVLDARLAALDIPVERPVRLAGLAQDQEGVTALVDRGAYTERIRARFVVGADGAHSTVRKLSEIAFVGEAYPQDFVLGDVALAGELADGDLHFFLGRRGMLACLPLSGAGRVRLIASRGRVSAGDDPPTLDELGALARAMTGRDLALSDPTWLARFRLHHRGAVRYREGRVFLAGDAAHIHSPAGGQGMNTGIQDAFNLAWKLAAVLGGRGGEALLASYHAERHPVGQRLLRFTDRLFRLATSTNPLVAGLRSGVAARLLPRLVATPARRRRALRFTTQLGIHHRGGPLAPKERRPLPAGPRPGERAPDVALPDGRLFDHLRRPRFDLLAFAGGRPLDVEEITGALGPHASVVDVHLVASRATPGAIDDTGGAAHRAYGAEEGAFYLLRPDGHVAARGRDLAPVLAWLRAFL